MPRSYKELNHAELLVLDRGDSGDDDLSGVCLAPFSTESDESRLITKFSHTSYRVLIVIKNIVETPNESAPIRSPILPILYI